MNDVVKTILPILPWVPTILLGFCLLWAFLSGIRRGFSKSLKLFITFLIAIALSITLFFILRNQFDTILAQVGDIVLGWFDKSLQEVMNTTGKYDKFTDYLNEYISKSETFQEYVASSGSSVEETARLIFSLSMLIVNVALAIICFILFFVFKFILYIFYLIFAKEGRRKKRINKAYADGKKDKPYKAHRLAGGFIGLLRGLIVSIFLLIPFGTVALLVTNNTDPQAVSNETLDDDNSSKTYFEFMKVINNYSSTGVGKILTSVKNPEGVPLYLLVSDTIFTTEYTYVDEESGEEKTVDLKLSRDLAPISGLVCQTAYQFLAYGYDVNKNYTSDELIEFLTSDKKVNGYTLEEKITSLLSAIDTKEETMISYLMDSFTKSYVKSYLKDNVNEQNIESQDLDKKILYHLFLGENSLKPSEIVLAGNADNAFKAFMIVLKNKDTLTRLQNVFSTNEEESTNPSLAVNKLVFGVSAKASENDVEESNSFMHELCDQLSSLSFYNTARFNRLITDLIIDAVSTSLPDFDLTSTTNQNLYSTTWTNSLDSIFGLVGDMISDIISQNISNTEELGKYYINQLSDSQSKTYTNLKNVINSDGVSIILNTKGFNNFIEESLNSALESIVGDSKIELIETNWGTYTNSDGNVVKGELEKLINSFATSFAPIYNILTESEDGNLTKEQTKDLIIQLTTKGFVDAFDVDSENHSNLIHAFVSDVLKADIISYNDTRFGLYVPSQCKQTLTLTNTTKEVISSEAIKSVLDFMKGLADDAYDLMKGNIDYVALIKSQTTAIRNSKIILANIAKIIYKMNDGNLIIPQRLSLADDVIDTNISLWIDTNGEMDKIIDIVNSFGELISDLSNGKDTNQILANITKDGGNTIQALSNSTIINATITNKIQALNDSNNFKIYIPNEAYNDIYCDTVKTSEFVSVIKYIKEIFNVTDDTKTVDLANIIYSKLLGQNAITLLKNSSIMVTTVSYFFKDIIVTKPEVADKLVIPNELLAELNDETIITDYANSEWKEELVALLSNLELLGVTFGDNNQVSIDLRNVFYLGDTNTADNTKTNMDILYKSQILKASLNKSLTNVENIYIPRTAYDGDYVSANELAQTLRAFKELIGTTNLENDSFNIDNVKDYIDLSRFSDMDQLDNLIKPQIVNATIAYMIMTQDASSEIICPDAYKFNKENEDNLVQWLYSSDTDLGETIKLIHSINSLNLLGSVSSGNATISPDILLTFNDDAIETLLASDIINATIINTLVAKRSSAINIPASYIVTSEDIVSNYRNIKFVTNSEANKLLKGLTRLGSSLDVTEFDMNILKNLNEVEASSSQKKIETILDSDILWYSMSSYILDINSINISTSVKDQIDSENYIVKAELVHLINSLASLSISSFDSISYDTILTISDLDSFLGSDIIWYTVSSKMFSATTITLSDNEIVTPNSDDELYIIKDELKTFVNTIKLFTASSLDDVLIDPVIVVDNIDTVADSSIVRTLITKKIIDSNNNIVLKRTNSTTNEVTTYANLYNEYQNGSLTGNKVVQLTKAEIEVFVSAVKTIFGDNTVQFNINYNDTSVFNFTSMDESLLDSTIILDGLQTKFNDTINGYNYTQPESNKYVLTDDYTYDIYSATAANNHISYPSYISVEEAKGFVDKIRS